MSPTPPQRRQQVRWSSAFLRARAARVDGRAHPPVRRRSISTRRHGPSARREPWARHAGLEDGACSITLSVGHHGVIVIGVSGELDSPVMPVLDDLVGSMTRDGLPYLLDCTAVTFSSTAIASVLSRHDVRRELVIASPPVQRVLELADVGAAAG